MTKELLAQIDEEAEADQRTRSNWIVKELTLAVRHRQQMRGIKAKDFEVAGEKPGAGVGGPSSSSTRPSPQEQEPTPETHRKPSPGDPPSGLNETSGRPFKLPAPRTINYATKKKPGKSK